MYRLIRIVLFSLPPEVAHSISLASIKLLSFIRRSDGMPPKSSPITVMGIPFNNPVGLAAGLDKNGEYVDALGSLGFGAIEVGTVTPKPQAGNPKPRLFRLTGVNAIINRMGFNNKGVDYLVEQVKNIQYRGVLGINIGKNKATRLENALDDYIYCMQKVYPVADYIVINVSSPNTPGLRGLQHGELLDALIAGIKDTQQQLARQYNKRVPVAYKVAPDLDQQEVTSICETFNQYKVDAIISTNTTVSRKGVESCQYAEQAGGLSGEPLFGKSTEVLHQFRMLLHDDIPIIGVGGIFSADDARSKITAGASLVQVYTGLVYKGPSLIKKMISVL